MHLLRIRKSSNGPKLGRDRDPCDIDFQLEGLVDVAIGSEGDVEKNMEGGGQGKSSVV